MVQTEAHGTGKKYIATKDRIQKHITTYLTTLVDRLNKLFDLNFDQDTTVIRSKIKSKISAN